MNSIYRNNVDVTECGFRHEDTGEECHIALAFSEDYGVCFNCEQIPECYYKKWKRELLFSHNVIDAIMRDYTYDGEIAPNGFDIFDVIKKMKADVMELRKLKEEK